MRPIPTRRPSRAMPRRRATREAFRGCSFWRPAWVPADGDMWIEVSDPDEAADVVADSGVSPDACVFLTTGARDVQAFRRLRATRFLVRLVEVPQPALPLARFELIIDPRTVRGGERTGAPSGASGRAAGEQEQRRRGHVSEARGRARASGAGRHGAPARSRAWRQGRNRGRGASVADGDGVSDGRTCGPAGFRMPDCPRRIGAAGTGRRCWRGKFIDPRPMP